MANQEKRTARAQRARPTPQRRRRRAEHIALSARAHCGPRRRRTRHLAPAVLLFALIATLALLPDIPATSEPTPGATHWTLNAPTAHQNPHRSGAIDIPLMTPTPDLRWQSATGEPILAGAVMDDVRVYTVDREGVVTARVLGTGSISWTHDLNEAVVATPALGYGWLYVATLDGTLHALETRTGNVMGEASLSGEARAPTMVHQARVYQGTEAGILDVLDAEFLQPLWQFNTATISFANGTVDQEDNDRNAPIRAAPAMHDGRIFVTTIKGHIHALSQSGNDHDNPTTLYWSHHVGETVNAAPAIDRHNDRVILPTQDGRIQARNAQTGQLVWQSTATAEFTSGIAVDDKQVIARTSDAGLYSLNTTNGAHQWTYNDPSGHLAAPILAQDAIVSLSGNGTLTLLSRTTGHPLPHPQTDDGIARWSLTGATHATPVVTKHGIGIVDHAGSFTLIGAAPDLRADLKANPISITSMPIGPRLGLNLSVENQGPDPAPEVQLRIERNGNLHKERMLGPLAVGEQHTYAFQFESNPGEHELKVTFRAVQATDPDPEQAITTNTFTLDEEPDLEDPLGDEDEASAAVSSPSFGRQVMTGLAWAAVPGGLAGAGAGIMLARRLRTPTITPAPTAGA